MSDTCPYCLPATAWGGGPEMFEMLKKWHDDGHPPKATTQGNDLAALTPLSNLGTANSPLSAPTNTDELSKLLNETIQVYKLQRGESKEGKVWFSVMNEPFALSFDYAEQRLARLIALKQREELEYLLEGDNTLGGSLLRPSDHPDDVRVVDVSSEWLADELNYRPRRAIREYIQKRIKRLNTIIEGEK